MKIFGFGKDKSVQKMDKPDTSGMENLGQEKTKAEFGNFIGDDKSYDELVNRTAVDLIGDKWPRQSLYHGSAFGVEWNTDPENKIFSKSELDLAVGINLSLIHI